MIHVTRSRLPEIVLFGSQQRLECPLALEAGNQIMVRGVKPGEIAVSKFAANEPDQKRIVSDRVDEVIRAIVELGGTYPDVVQALQAAKSAGALASRFEVDALPEAGRTYDRGLASSAEDSRQSAPRGESPSSEVSANLGGVDCDCLDAPPREPGENGPKPANSNENDQPAGGFFDRIVGRKSG